MEIPATVEVMEGFVRRTIIMVMRVWQTDVSDGFARYCRWIGKIGIAKLSHIINFTKLILAFPLFNITLVLLLEVLVRD